MPEMFAVSTGRMTLDTFRKHSNSRRRKSRWWCTALRAQEKALAALPGDPFLDVAIIRMNHNATRMDPPFTQDIEEKGDVPYVINHIHTSLAKHAFESRLAWPECLDAATLRHLVTRSSDYFMSGRQSVNSTRPRTSWAQCPCGLLSDSIHDFLAQSCADWTAG
jgi:hypothetical protein